MAFRLPTHTIIGPGSLGQLAEILTSLPDGCVAVVTDPGVRASGWSDRVEWALSGAGRAFVVLDGVEPNPRVATVDRLADEARAADCRSVIAIGGGSAIDAAKGIALLLTNPGSCRDYEGRNQFASAAAPLVAIPTTCGTGSEVTWVSVLSLEEDQRKISVKGDGMFPTWAIVDADVLATAPPALIASTGMDALTHAVEAILANCSNPASDALAEKAVLLLMEYLERAVADPESDVEARRQVMLASTLAGMAFGNADVGAVHCLSESLGGVYDLPHGLLNAMLLVPVVREHGSAAASGLANLEDACARRLAPPEGFGHADASELFIARLEDLARRCAIPAFSTLGLHADSFERIAQLAVRNGSNGSNPREWTEEDYRRVLDAAAA